MQASYRSRLPVHKGLHAQADAIHAAAPEAGDHFVRERAGSAFHGNLGSVRNLEILRNRDKYPLQLSYIQYCRGSASEIDGVDGPLEPPTHLAGDRAGLRYLAAHAV